MPFESAPVRSDTISKVPCDSRFWLESCREPRRRKLQGWIVPKSHILPETIRVSTGVLTSCGRVIVTASLGTNRCHPAPPMPRQVWLPPTLRRLAGTTTSVSPPHIRLEDASGNGSGLMNEGELSVDGKEGRGRL